MVESPRVESQLGDFLVDLRNMSIKEEKEELWEEETSLHLYHEMLQPGLSQSLPSADRAGQEGTCGNER